MCFKSLSAEFWFRIMAKTLRLERNAAVMADVPMFPVDPTTRTVSIAVENVGENLKDVIEFFPIPATYR